MVGTQCLEYRKFANFSIREIILNAVSLACGFTGNFFLLLNFTRRVRYIVALPLSIIFWYFATGIVSKVLL
jgi:potassium channel subfamily K